MAELVGIFAVSHAPPIVRDWDRIDSGRRARMDSAFAQLGERILAARPDVMVVIGADHWTNFFLNNMPAMCVGVGTDHSGPPEPWLADYPHAMRGHPALAMHLAHSAFAQGFEPSVSHQLRLDHGFCVPLWKAGVASLPPIVPIIINVMQAPFPTVGRCIGFGQVCADAVRSFSAPLRVVLLASGGMSHSVGEARMGMIDEMFDRDCLEAFAAGGAAPISALLSDQRMAAAGNGAHELRFWAAAHGAAGCQGFDLLHYEAVPETYTGCGFAQWHLRTDAKESV